MTTPTIIASTAPAKFVPQNDITDIVTYTVPTATAADAVIGMIPFKKGCRLVSGWIQVADLDLGTTVTLDVGYVYVTGSTGTDNSDAFIDNSTLPQAGGIATFPVASGLSTSTELSTSGAADDGYFVIVIKSDPTEQAGAVTLCMTMNYGQ